MSKGQALDLTPNAGVVSLHKYEAAVMVLATRERELLALKGPCSTWPCRLHYAHSGPCDRTKKGGDR